MARSAGPMEATVITEHFGIGDKVEWVTVRRVGSPIDIKKHDGTIDAIEGSKALIKSPWFKRRRRVSLFELKVIGGK